MGEDRLPTVLPPASSPQAASLEKRLLLKPDYHDQVELPSSILRRGQQT